jgi:hypothetical protein
MIAAGVVMISGGLGLLVAGAAMVGGSKKYDTVGCSGDYMNCHIETNVNTGKQSAGYGLLLGGLILAGVGVPILVIGARKVPVERDALHPTARLHLGPGSVALRGSF